MIHAAWRRFTLAAALGAAIACAGAPASEGPPPVLNPKTYHSPSGEWSLRVEPGEKHGCGEGLHRLLRAGAEAWSATLPYTLWDARVSDDGLVVGYAYSLGWRGFPREPGGEWNGDLRIVMLNPDQTPRLDLVIPRGQSNALHSPPTPIVQGIFTDPDNDMLVLRVRDEREQDDFLQTVWWRFQLSTHARLADVRPMTWREAGGVSRWELAAEAIPGRPLVATVWSRVEWRDNKSRLGATIVVFDLDGKEVGRLDRPDEYSTDEEAYAARPSDGRLRRGRGPGEFEFASSAEKAWLRFGVEAIAAPPGGWFLTERGRAESPFTDAASPPDAPADIALEHRGTITLETGEGPPSPIHNIHQFAFDDRGRIGFIPGASDGPPEFVLVEQDGSAVFRTRLDALADAPHGFATSVASLGKDRWIAVTNPIAYEAKGTALRIDAATGSVELLDIADCPPAQALQGRPDGGFYVLGMRRFKYTMTDELDAYDGQGRLLWRVEQGHDLREKIFSPQDIATTPQGVAVLEGIRNCIKRFDASGKYAGEIDLEAMWGHKPNYVTHLDADGGAGHIVFDFGAPSPALVLDAAGKIVASFTPRFADGKVFAARGGVRRSPTGDLWTSDGDSLLRLSPDGAVAAVAGRAPDSDANPLLVVWALDANSRLYALNERTNAVLVFSPAGALERVLRPLPDDFDKGAGVASLAASPDGTVFMNIGAWSERAARGYLRFAPSGERTGFEPRRGNWLFRRNDADRWEVAHDRVSLLGPDGAVKRVIDHAADGTWLESIFEASVAPDGSLAVISTGRDRFAATLPVLSLYAPEGAPTLAVPCPSDLSYLNFAFDGASAVLGNAKGLWVFEPGTRTFQRVRLPDRFSAVRWDGVLLSPDGKEAWAITSDPAKIERFALP